MKPTINNMVINYRTDRGSDRLIQCSLYRMKISQLSTGCRQVRIAHRATMATMFLHFLQCLMITADYWGIVHETGKFSCATKHTRNLNVWPAWLLVRRDLEAATSRLRLQ